MKLNLARIFVGWIVVVASGLYLYTRFSIGEVLAITFMGYGFWLFVPVKK